MNALFSRRLPTVSFCLKSPCETINFIKYPKSTECSILTKSGLCPIYVHFMQVLRCSHARRFRHMWRRLKFTLILEVFQKSTFDINLPVILSIPLGVDDKKSGCNFHQTSVSVGRNAFSHLSNLPSPSENGSPRTEDHHFLKKKKTAKEKKTTSAGPYSENVNIMLVLDYFLKASWLPKTEHKSKTSKKWKKLIFAHADLDDTSNEIRRGRKLVGSKNEKK